MHAQLRKPPQSPIQKKKKKPHRCDGNGTINYICKHTYAYTERASSGTAVRGDSYVDKRLQDERGGMMSVAETGKGDQAAWTSERTLILSG